MAAFGWGWRAGSKGRPESGPTSRRENPARRAPASAATQRPEPDAPPAQDVRMEQWRRDWKTLARTPRAEQEAERVLQDWARRDPARALAVALDETSLALRERLRDAVLRGWAAVAPENAADWAVALPAGEHRAALAAVFAGAAEQPEAAARLGEDLCRRLPAEATDCGQLLIAALTEAGAYETAAKFALTGGPEQSPARLNAAYFQWALRQPEQALRAFGAIADPAVRDAAFAGLTAGWAEANSAAAASYATQLPAGADRAAALGQTLAQWATRDPITASEWMLKNFSPSPDLDGSVAAVASLPSLVSQRPEIAIGWAEAIAEPELRTRTLTAVAQTWAQRDPEGARRFVLTTTSLSREERAALEKGLTDGP